MPPPAAPLFFLSDLDGGGAQRTTINLVRHWPEDRTRPVLAVARAAGPGRPWLDGIHPVDLGAGRLRRAFLPLRRLIRRRRPELVYSTMVGANIVAATSVIGLRRPPLLVARETNSHRARGDLSRAQRGAAGWAYRRAAAVVALSEGVRGELVEDCRLEPERVVTIHNPVDVDDFQKRARGSARPWPGEGPMVVAAGRLVRQKGFDILLRAFAQLRTKDARLAILGEGSDREALMRFADELGVAERIVMPGHVADIAPWLAHAAAFALSSRWEGFGHVIVEAMACGAPVVAFDCPHGPADIIEDGRTGVLVPPLEGDALAAALDRVLGDGEFAQRLRAAGRPAAMRFSAPAIARAYAGLFDDLCAAARH
ncbi:MAG: glycosyltransferase [Alphaproteobacteria bacterium]|nr:glycosyltransferase [Alphaproteobacteria bacterium]